jgi:hypothetical protein
MLGRQKILWLWVLASTVSACKGIVTSRESWVGSVIFSSPVDGGQACEVAHTFDQTIVEGRPSVNSIKIKFDPLGIPDAASLDIALRGLSYGGERLEPDFSAVWSPAAATPTLDISFRERLAIGLYSLRVRSTYRTEVIHFVVLPGDMNGDLSVDVSDVNEEISQFGGSECRWDMSADGVVDLSDVAVILSYNGYSFNLQRTEFPDFND